jgi:protein O-GlcNAc transferase
MMSPKFGIISLLIHFHIKIILADFWSELLLPEEHIPYYFYNNRNVRDKCISDDSCPYKVS